ncbi:plant virulence effector HPE1-like domain-containing protein [Pararhizobium sp.]|uniref:plant virulence effector HPE1-like domain-containing protein n=1 Tax=Pararhizobium sp. TaxID=1977563 RepID=UPI0027223E6A|nr:plant virulence effector HPE1-like domain-containing protein [Pararhizobium sp.]MDO9415696.1 plant virulence effector HPE1-like domain-containing protein [Pararhizobium sp.]
MRHLIFTVVFALVSGSAGASSIEPIVSGASVNHSISKIDCSSCPPLIDTKKSKYPVVDLKPGTQTIELKTIDGEMKVVRTEAWLGGSPVTFIQKATDEEIKAGVATGNPDAMVAVDASATTSAVSDDAPPAQSREFDPSAFELRLK